MAAKHKVTVSTAPTTHRLSSAERRAAQIAAIATKQADLKREAAERRAKRELQGGARAASASHRKAASARRSNSR